MFQTTNQIYIYNVRKKTYMTSITNRHDSPTIPSSWNMLDLQELHMNIADAMPDTTKWVAGDEPWVAKS